MKMIYAGSLATAPDRDSGWIASFENLGCTVIPFCTASGISKTGFIERLYRRLNIGPKNGQMQQALLRLAEHERPVWIHFRLPLEFNRGTIKELKNRGIILTQYFNDDPFSKRSPLGLHWKFRWALPAFDAHFVYRAHNVGKYLAAGATHVEHCPPTYDPRRHSLTYLSSPTKLLADAAFIGHWEDDWRTDCLDALIEAGFEVIVKGGMWAGAIKGRSTGKLAPITHAFGPEYNHIYGNVIAGLCFFSKINNDSWTERALEIIAVGGLLVCERTDEALTYFKDREEACFFSSTSELIDIVRMLKNSPARRERIRTAGYARLQRTPSTIDHRARQVYSYVAGNLGAKALMQTKAHVH